MPPELNEKFLDDLVADPAKFRREWEAKAREEHPDMTAEQLAEAWRHASALLGLQT